MAQVSVTIDGKAYRMACEEGQEDHLTDLASRFDQYVSHLKGQFGEIGDLRLTVMAAIMVTDELSEVDRRLKALQAEVDGLKRARDAAVADQTQAEEALASALGEVTHQIQGLASRIANRQPAAHPPQGKGPHGSPSHISHNQPTGAHAQSAAPMHGNGGSAHTTSGHAPNSHGLLGDPVKSVR